MKGILPTNSLFKILPKLIINSYQGSMGSTSQGVQNIFEKAKNNKKEDIILNVGNKHPPSLEKKNMNILNNLKKI